MSFQLGKLAICMMISTMIWSPSIANAQKTHFERNSKRQEHPYGGTLVWGTSNPPTIINPILTQHSVSASIIPLVFDGLVRINSKDQIEPALAESWEISEDQHVYTFKLKEGIRFHDGVELTAEDVKFTYDQIKDPKVGSVYRSHFQSVEKFEIVDRYKFRIVLKKPFPDLLYKTLRS